MDYRNNPYCTLGLPVNATQRQVVARVDELKAAAAVGMVPESVEDPVWVRGVDRSIEAIERARQQLENLERRPRDMLTWYWEPREFHCCPEPLEVLKEGRYLHAGRFCQDVLEGRLGPEEEVCYRVNCILAISLLLREDTQRNGRFFRRLRCLIAQYCRISERIDSLQQLPHCDGVAADTVLRELRICLMKNLVEADQVPKHDAKVLVDEINKEYTACVQLLERNRFLDPLVSVLPRPGSSLPVTGDVWQGACISYKPGKAPGQVPNPTSVPFWERVWQLVLAWLDEHVRVAAGYAFMLGVVALIVGVPWAMEAAFSRAPRVDDAPRAASTVRRDRSPMVASAMAGEFDSDEAEERRQRRQELSDEIEEYEYELEDLRSRAEDAEYDERTDDEDELLFEAEMKEFEIEELRYELEDLEE